MAAQTYSRAILLTFSVDMQGLAFSIAAESVVYGLYTVLFIMSSWFLLRRKLRARADIFMFAINTLMFLCATAHWALALAYVSNIGKWYIEALEEPVPFSTIPNSSSTDRIVNAINSASQHVSFANYVLNDIVVIWRAWLVSGTRAKKWIIGVGICAIVIEVPLFLVAMQLPDAPSVTTSKKVRVSLMDLLTPMSYFITLLTNIWATAIVARKAWILRRQLKRASLPFGRASPVGKILILLLESGGLYCMVWALYLAMFSADLVETAPFIYPSALSIIFFYVLGICMVYYAGMYLSMVIVLVCLQRTFGEHIVIYSSPSDIPTPRGLTLPTDDRAASSHIRSRIEFQQPHSIVRISTNFSSPDLESNTWPARASMTSSRHGVSMDSGAVQPQLGPVVERNSYRDSSSEYHSTDVAEKKEEHGFAV